MPVMYANPGTCPVHGIELEEQELFAHSSVYVCPQCEAEEIDADDPEQKLIHLQRVHIETLHELGAVKAELKKAYAEGQK